MSYAKNLLSALALNVRELDEQEHRPGDVVLEVLGAGEHQVDNGRLQLRV